MRKVYSRAQPLSPVSRKRARSEQSCEAGSRGGRGRPFRARSTKRPGFSPAASVAVSRIAWAVPFAAAHVVPATKRRARNLGGARKRLIEEVLAEPPPSPRGGRA